MSLIPTNQSFNYNNLNNIENFIYKYGINELNKLQNIEIPYNLRNLNLILPKSLNLKKLKQQFINEFGNSWKQADKHFYDALIMINIMLERHFVSNPDYKGYKVKDGYIGVFAKTWREFCHKDKYVRVRKILSEFGVLEYKKSYKVGLYPKPHRIKSEYLNDDIKYHTIYYPAGAKRMILYRANIAIPDEISKYILNTFKRTSINNEKFKKWRQNHENELSSEREKSINDLNQVLNHNKWNKFFFKRLYNGRLYNSFTNCPKEVREFIRIDNEKTIELDIKNCQPYLLVQLYDKKQELHIFEQQRLIKFFEDNDFYDFFREKINKDMTRDEFKEYSYQNLFFGSINSYISNQLYDIFYDLFPILANIILDMKKNRSKREFAMSMQRREAKIVIDDFGNKMMELNIPFLTVHDSVIIKEKHKNIVSKILIQEFFKNTGIIPELKIK